MMAPINDPFAVPGQILEIGAEGYLRLLRDQIARGYQLSAKRKPAACYAPDQEELYQTLFCLETYGKIVPYQNRCAVVPRFDPNPWMRIGRPSKVELLMMVLFALAKGTGSSDAAVLLSRENHGVILGFDYGHDERQTSYIVGSSLLINFPTLMTENGVLVTIKAPDRFILLQAENKGIRTIYYYEGALGDVEDRIHRSISPRVSLIKLQPGFWHYNSLLDPENKVPPPFGDIAAGGPIPLMELSSIVALLARTRANCLKRKVGAVILDLYDDERFGTIRSLGYNGFKSGFYSSDDCEKHFCQKRRSGGKDDRLCFSPCAEIDAFRGFYHDEAIKQTFSRARLKKRDPGPIRTAAVTTIEPCERCTSILFENGIFDYFPLEIYNPARTILLGRLKDQKKINVTYLGDPAPGDADSQKEA
jgi:deoxycytidylate deaminase